MHAPKRKARKNEKPARFPAQHASHSALASAALSLRASNSSFLLGLQYAPAHMTSDDRPEAAKTYLLPPRRFLRLFPLLILAAALLMNYITVPCSHRQDCNSCSRDTYWWQGCSWCELDKRYLLLSRTSLCLPTFSFSCHSPLTGSCGLLEGVYDSTYCACTCEPSQGVNNSACSWYLEGDPPLVHTGTRSLAASHAQRHFSVAVARSRLPSPLLPGGCLLCV